MGCVSVAIHSCLVVLATSTTGVVSVKSIEASFDNLANEKAELGPQSVYTLT
jgi:hypothetical protein